MASDMVGEMGLIKGNAVSLSLTCQSEKEIRNCYAKLSAKGSSDHTLQNSFWGALSGDLKDQFGNHWILTFNKQSNYLK